MTYPQLDQYLTKAGELRTQVCYFEVCMLKSTCVQLLYGTTTHCTAVFERTGYSPLIVSRFIHPKAPPVCEADVPNHYTMADMPTP